MTSDNNCNVPCSGFPGEMCGAAGTGSVYKSDPNVQYPPASTTLNGINGYQGCYTLNSMTAAVGYVSDAGMTIESCISNCGELGYTVWRTFSFACICTKLTHPHS